jgi:hypothetical protein
MKDLDQDSQTDRKNQAQFPSNDSIPQSALASLRIGPAFGSQGARPTLFIPESQDSPGKSLRSRSPTR